jgi:hypothetical protein
LQYIKLQNIRDKISEINLPLLDPDHAGQDLKRKKKI